MILPVVDVIMTLLTIALGTWVINNYVPMTAMVRNIVNLVIVVAVGIWLLQVFGMWPLGSSRASL
jgi:hypothetical protein